jgi:site-specific DNA-methyltransferase (adenine-specific)
MGKLAPASVDLILTDPPYPGEFQHLYGKMAEIAKDVLVPGGSLVTLCGHYQVPAICNDIGEHLRFWWIGGMRHTSMVRLPGKWVAITWKPALWFVKGGRKKRDTRCPVDLMEGGGKDKAHHHWGQPVHWFSHWIENLTSEGETVLDPFMGGGTTGVAAILARRHFIGCEIDETHYNTACERIAEIRNPQQPELFSAA